MTSYRGIPIYQLGNGRYQAKWTEHGQKQRMSSASLRTLKARLKAHLDLRSAKTLNWDKLTMEQEEVCLAVLRRGFTMADLDRISGAPEPIALSDAVKAFIEAKEAASGTSERNVRDLRGVLTRLIKSLGPDADLGLISPMQLDEWLIRQPGEPSTRKNLRAALVTFWRWCRAKEMLPDNTITAAEKTDCPKVQRKEVEVWTPAELKTMLENVRADYLPWIAIQAFAGLRTAELFAEQRSRCLKPVLQWEHVRLTGPERFIEVPAAVAKTGDRRIVPICETLAEWLEKLHKGSGPICPKKAPSRRNHKEATIIESLSTALGIPWKKNALRHSYGSYRTAQTKDMARVSLEMGNSIAMIKRHYHHAQTETEAQEWFSFGPEKVDRRVSAQA